MYNNLLDLFENLYSYQKYLHIIFFSALGIVLFLLLLKKYNINLGLISRLKYIDYPGLLNIPLFILCIFVFFNLILFFLMPSRSNINPVRVQSLNLNQIKDLNIESTFHQRLYESEYNLTPTVSLYQFFGYYNPIFFIELISSVFFIYIIILSILYGTDFI